jgi:predicted XRE-type DNA-binding protein
VRRHNGRKLTKEKVSEIKRLWDEAAMTQAEIAEQFGIGQTMVSHIVTGKTWKGVK